METKKVVKGVSQFASGMGTGMIVANIVCATMPAGIGVFTKALISAGQLAIGMMASEKVSDYVGDKIEEAFTPEEEVNKEPKVSKETL